MPKSKAKKENSSKTSTHQADPAPEIENKEVLIETLTHFDNPEDVLIHEKNTPIPDTEFTDSRIKAIVQEIVNHFNALPQERDHRIVNIIETQTERLQKKTAGFEHLKQSFEMADKQCTLTKKALRKAKDHKLDKARIGLIKFERRRAKIERKHLKHLMKQEKRNLKNVRKIIRLLELTD